MFGIGDTVVFFSIVFIGNLTNAYFRVSGTLYWRTDRRFKVKSIQFVNLNANNKLKLKFLFRYKV